MEWIEREKKMRWIKYEDYRKNLCTHITNKQIETKKKIKKNKLKETCVFVCRCDRHNKSTLILNSYLLTLFALWVIENDDTYDAVIQTL